MPPRTRKIEYVSLAGLRLDGRKPQDVRAVGVEIDTFGGGADGSCVVEMGSTRVAAAVYGPREVQGARGDRCQISCECQFAAFASASGQRRVVRSDAEKVTDAVEQVRATLNDLVLAHLYPNSAIQVHLEVLSDDGSVVTALLNAASCALVSAGVPVRDLLCSCSSTLLQEHYLVDINEQERRGAGPELSVAILPSTGRIALLTLDVQVDADKFQRLLDEATKGARKIHEELKKVLSERAKELLQTTSKDVK